MPNRSMIAAMDSYALPPWGLLTPRTMRGLAVGLTAFAFKYFVFGIAPLVARMFNALAGGLITLYTYRLTAAVFGRPSARLAAFWSIFVPSLVLWSSLNMRDI